jgi:hypothetical protein
MPTPQQQNQVTNQANLDPAVQPGQDQASGGMLGRLRAMAFGQASQALRPQAPVPQRTVNPGGRMLLPEDFQSMWDAHPHNYQADSSQNTSSEDVQTALGWDANQYGNTCAIRASVMFNTLGGDYAITVDRAKAAGIPRGRLAYSPTKKSYIILSAKEMWTYVSYWFGQPSMQWPAGEARFKTTEQFQTAYDSTIRAAITGKKGFVGFDKIFGYSGSGHVDLFDGELLSDAGSWYPCQSLKVWFV